MRIALIGHGMRAGGGPTVGINFVRCLTKVAPAHQFLLIGCPGVGLEGIRLPSGSKVIFFSDKGNLFRRLKFDFFELPRLIKQFKPDVVFGLGNCGLTNPPCKQAIWIQDAHYVYPSKHFHSEIFLRRLSKAFHKFRLKRCMKKTQLFFCQTPVMRKRFAEHFRYPIENVKILPNAVSEFAKKNRDKCKVPNVLACKGWFNLFFLGDFYPQKNQELLIELFAKYKEQLSDVRCIVTINPNHHQNAPKFLSDIEKNNLRQHIINTGTLRQDELADYFYNSDVLFFPTLLESFSATYLEAMYFELPIITSDLDFARCICGDAAVYFNPWDMDDIVNKILLIKNEPRLRKKLKENGFRRVSSFYRSWGEIVSEAIREMENLVVES